jgi:hypothetical protein
VARAALLLLALAGVKSHDLLVDRRSATASAFREPRVNPQRRPLSGALKAGWFCCGVGLALSWLLPFGHGFFCVALVMSIIAMSARQMNRGLLLLVSSLGGSAVSVLVFFAAVTGTLGRMTDATYKTVAAQLRRGEGAQQQIARDLHRSNQALQAMSYGAAPSIGSSRQTLNVEVASRQQQTVSQADEAAAFEETARQRRREALRELEEEHDQANARQAQIDDIQKSVEWYEEQIHNCRAKGRDWRWYEEHRDALLKRRGELAGR